jgi:hypothetical protein
MNPLAGIGRGSMIGSRIGDFRRSAAIYRMTTLRPICGCYALQRGKE